MSSLAYKYAAVKESHDLNKKNTLKMFGSDSTEGSRSGGVRWNEIDDEPRRESASGMMEVFRNIVSFGGCVV
jgi:hypothetical protein